MPKKQITCCPYCGSTEGLYCKDTYVVDVSRRFGFNNEEQENSGMFDSMKEIRQGETAYCQKCHRAVCRMNTLRKQWRGFKL